MSPIFMHIHGEIKTPQPPFLWDWAYTYVTFLRINILLWPTERAKAVMYSAPIFLDLGSIRSNWEKLDLDPIQIHNLPVGSRFDPDPIRSRSLHFYICIDPPISTKIHPIQQVFFQTDKSLLLTAYFFSSFIGAFPFLAVKVLSFALKLPLSPLSWDICLKFEFLHLEPMHS